MGGYRQLLTADRFQTASSGLTTAYPHLSVRNIFLLWWGSTSLFCSTPTPGHSAQHLWGIQKSWMNAPEKRQASVLEDTAFPREPYRLRTRILPNTAFLGTQFNNTANSLSSQDCVLLERLYARSCHGDSTCLALTWYWFRRNKGEGKPTAVL